MSTRQNKKRKGRNNVNNRERTVTTLTEDPNTPYLVPTPSEEPAGANLMSSPFSVASSSGGNPNNIPASGYQIPGTFGFGYNNFMGPIHGNVHHQHQQQAQGFFPSQPQPPLPPGQNDLEVLEKLKDIIKSGQHEFYRAVPQPAALASIYLGPNATQSHVPHHPDQAPSEYQAGNTYSTFDGSSQANSAAPSSPVDLGRRPPRIQNKEGWDGPGPRKPVGPPTVGGLLATNNSTQASLPQGQGSRYMTNNSSNPNVPHGVNTSNLNNGKIPPGPPSAGIKSGTDMRHPLDTKPSATAVPPAGGPDSIPPSQRSARFDSANNNSNNLRPQGGPPPSPRLTQKADQQRPPGDRLGPGESAYERGAPRGAPTDLSPDKTSLFDGKEEARISREGGWRDGQPPDERRARDLDRSLPPLSANGSNLDSRPPPPGVNDPAGGRPLPPGPPARYYDRDRERERERDRLHERDREWERDRDRDRRPDARFRDERSRLTDMRRPPPDQRHYEPAYDRPPPPPRRYDPLKPDEPLVGGDRRGSDPRAPLPPLADDRGVRPPHVDDRQSRPPIDDRAPPPARATPADARSLLPDARAPPPDARPPVRGPPVDDRHARPVPGDDRRGGPPTDDRTNRPPPNTRPAEAQGANRPAGEDRGARAPPPPLPPVEDRNARPSVPLEERLSRPQPSLQDRLSQPPATRADSNRLNRQPSLPSLEERLSHPSGVPADHSSRPIPLSQSDDRLVRPVVGAPERDRVTRPGAPDERSTGRGGLVEPARPPLQDERPGRLEERSGRAGDRYVRPLTPVQDRAPLSRSTGYAGAQRSSSVLRDDPRVPKISPSPPPHRPEARDYRAPPPPGRDPSRERSDMRPPNSYRPENDRGYNDDRRPDLMDVDGPPRFTDNRAPYIPRRFSPPSSTDISRDRARGLYAPPSPPPRSAPAGSDAPPYDVDPDRRFATQGDRREWPYPYPDRRRDWNPSDEDYWKYKGGNNSDRDRFEREAPPPPPPSSGRNGGWETREERERRGAFPGASPTRSFDGVQGRPLSSRLTDAYPSGPGPADNRAYPPPPRDMERSRYPPPPGGTPPFSRVRQRSPSPVGRRPGPGPGPGGVGDDMRPPPPKRQRDDGYPAGYYSPQGRDPARRGSIGGEYPRVVTPPPSSGSSYYDRGAPPVSGGAGGADRDSYVSGRGDYGPGPGPSSYDRPRSPGPPSRLSQGYRGGYGSRGGDPRDDRRYTMPPPPPRTA